MQKIKENRVRPTGVSGRKRARDVEKEGAIERGWVGGGYSGRPNNNKPKATTTTIAHIQY